MNLLMRVTIDACRCLFNKRTANATSTWDGRMQYLELFHYCAVCAY